MSSQNSNPLALIAAQQQQTAAAAAANPVLYVPASKKDEIRESHVRKVHAVCHPITSTSGSGKTNHWTLSFDIGNGRGVELDIRPNPQLPYTNGGSKACVVISLLYNVVTTNAVRDDLVSITCSRPLSWYIDYLASGGRFRYAFTSDGVGCRQWITDTLQFLSDIAEVDSAESESARRTIAYLWPDARPAAPAAGIYFS